MAKPSSGSESLTDRMRGIQINPLVLVAIGVVLVIGLGYTMWLKPRMDADKALRDFNTPEAQAKRDPDQRQVPAGLQAKIDALRAKESHVNTSSSFRRRRDE